MQLSRLHTLLRARYQLHNAVSSIPTSFLKHFFAIRLLSRNMCCLMSVYKNQNICMQCVRTRMSHTLCMMGARPCCAIAHNYQVQTQRHNKTIRAHSEWCILCHMFECQRNHPHNSGSQPGRANARTRAHKPPSVLHACIIKPLSVLHACTKEFDKDMLLKLNGNKT